MIQLTKKQHYIPRVYLKSWIKKWENNNEQLKIFNIKEKKEELRSKDANSICYKNWFYENQQDSPDNAIEDWLSKFENKFNINRNGNFVSISELIEIFCKIFKNNTDIYTDKLEKEQLENNFNININGKFKSISELIEIFCEIFKNNTDIYTDKLEKEQLENECKKNIIKYLSIEALKDYLTSNKIDYIKICNFIKEFMAIQYVRTPTALENMKNKLGLKNDIEFKPFDMIQFFQESTLSEKIKQLHMNIFYIPYEKKENYRFHTNDNPCVDYKFNLENPNQIGENDVIMTMPLSPSIMIFLTSKKYNFDDLLPFNIKIIEEEKELENLIKSQNNVAKETAENIVIL